LVGQLRIHDNKRNSVSRPMIWKWNQLFLM
jgi:hypothetical protein